jgi:hypothetical protein
MSVAESSVPAAELMRPAGTKPSRSACRKRVSQRARASGASAWASARATRRRTSSMLRSSPLAYFSSSTSSLIGCAASVGAVVPAVRAATVGLVVMATPRQA